MVGTILHLASTTTRRHYIQANNTHFNPHHLVSILDVHDVLGVHTIREELVDDLELVRILSRLPFDLFSRQGRSGWRKFFDFLFDGWSGWWSPGPGVVVVPTSTTTAGRANTADLHHVGLGVGELLDAGPRVAVVLDVRRGLGDVFNLQTGQSS